jgi:biopolymer transport protein ExbD
MAHKRSIQSRRGKKKNSLIELDITPLLDIFTVLLVFMVYSSQTSGFMTTTAHSIELPYSTSNRLSTVGVNVQVSKNKIWVNEKEVLTSGSMVPRELFDREGRKILPLYNHLVKLREKMERVREMTPKAVAFTGALNLAVDKTLNYNYLKRVMYTCSAAGFHDLKLIMASDSK